MTTPTKGVDTELEAIVKEYGLIALNETMQKLGQPKFKAAIKALIRQELEAVRAEMPEKQLSTLEDRPVTHGWNMAITEMTEKLDKRIEAL